MAGKVEFGAYPEETEKGERHWRPVIIITEGNGEKIEFVADVLCPDEPSAKGLMEEILNILTQYPKKNFKRNKAGWQ